MMPMLHIDHFSVGYVRSNLLSGWYIALVKYVLINSCSGTVVTNSNLHYMSIINVLHIGNSVLGFAQRWFDI